MRSAIEWELAYRDHSRYSFRKLRRETFGRGTLIFYGYNFSFEKASYGWTS